MIDELIVVADLSSDGVFVEGVKCKIKLPEYHPGKIELTFYPTKNQLAALESRFVFSMKARTDHRLGQATEVMSKKIYRSSSSTTVWDKDLSESTMQVDPVDLKIIEHVGKGDASEREIISGNYWLTDNDFLSPYEFMEQSYTGEIKTRDVERKSFTLDNGFAIELSNHYNFSSDDGKFTKMWPELVAEFKLPKKEDHSRNRLQQIDNFLCLVSFISRRRTVCTGWNEYLSEQFITNYRRSISIPKENLEHTKFDGIVDPRDFEEFMTESYKSFSSTKFDPLLKSSIYSATYNNEGVVETRFLRYYSVMEKLVLMFRRKNDLEFVFSKNSEWRDIKGKLKKIIKKEIPSNDKKTSRSHLYGKLEELNRIPFSYALDDFLGAYNIELDDLWPITSSDDGISLSDIRNKIVHGENIEDEYFRSLITASDHIQWIAERMVLRVLGWPVSKSLINTAYLKRNTHEFNRWTSDREIMSNQQDLVT